MRVKVYYNLHRKMFSVVSLDRYHRYGRVIRHDTEVRINCATFRVREAGRQRVLREKRKNVHAYVVGEFSYESPYPDPNAQEIIYNPYKYNSFVLRDSEEPVSSARVVWLSGKTIKAVDILKK